MHENTEIEHLEITDFKQKNKSPKKKYIIIFITSFVVVLLIIFLYFLFFVGKIDFKLDGEKETKTEVLTEYIDKGVISTHCTVIKCEKIDKYVTVKNNVNTKVLGTYDIVYTLNYKNKKRNIIRKVKVIDTEKPKLTLKGNTTSSVCPNKKYIEEGYLAVDNYDGDVTNKVIVVDKGDVISYVAKDSSGNTDTVDRKIIFEDKEKPQITLKGKQTIYIELGKNYVEPGYNANDSCDGNITSNVKIKNNINNKKAGTYYVNYEVLDNSGNKNTVSRKVIVYGLDKTNVSTYKTSLSNYIKSKGYKVSVGYYNLSTGYKYTYNSTKVYYGASLIKTLDALYLYEKASKGQLNLNTKITYQQKHKRGYSLGMQKYKVGDQISLKELIKYDITVSDNTAHAMLIDYIGFNNLKNYGNSLGGRYTLVGGDNFGQTTVDDQIAYMKKMYNFTNNSSNGRELRNYFINNYYNYISFSGMPSFAHKYGYHGIVFHDAGIVLDSKPYIIVILSNGTYVNRKDIFQDISKKVYELHKSF